MAYYKKLLYCFLCTNLLITSAQTESDYVALLTPPDLKENANSVVRFEKTEVTIEAYDKMVVNNHRIVTVLNKYGDVRHWNAREMYNGNQKIKLIEAVVYDAAGKEIKKFKKKDFKDQSAVSGATLYADDRMKYLSYNPVKYPYTVEYKSEVEYRSTAFVPAWIPITDYYLAVEHSEYNIINNSDVKIKTKPVNFEAFALDGSQKYSLLAQNIPGIKYEVYSPALSSIIPKYKVALETFKMEGVDGVNEDWTSFGKWMHTELLTGTDDVPQSAIDEVRELTKGVEDPMERARIVYQYVQSKTRYISVQIGIGGWKPIAASEIDELGYGDCKGLTNYTRALLAAVDVPSYYTVVYGDSDITDMDSDFSMTEGNHVILGIPTEQDFVFLECTSQSNPFGFTAGFTDDRDVLIITPDGGEIVHTKIYTPEESLQQTEAYAVLDELGNINGDINIKTTGYQYNLREDIDTDTERDQKLRYKEYWDYLNNLSIQSMVFNKDKIKVEFTESVSVKAANYASKTGNRLIFQPNIFNRLSSIPPRYKERQLDFEIDRGYKDVDEFIIEFPESMTIEALPSSEKLETKFGSYEFRVEALEKHKFKYFRSLVIEGGTYKKSEYQDFRDFRKTIARLDNSKVVLKQN